LRDGLRFVFSAVGLLAHLTRVLAHQKSDQAGHSDGNRGDEQHGQPPAVRLDDRGLAR
jgi:hypothetical protein